MKGQLVGVFHPRRVCAFLMALFLALGIGVRTGFAFADSAEGTESSQVVEIEVTCVENLIFSQYDIDVFVDGTELGTLDHGASGVFGVELADGVHTLTISKRGDASVDGNVEFSIPAEGALSFEANCTSDQVEIELLANEGASGEESDPAEGSEQVAVAEVAGNEPSVTFAAGTPEATLNKVLPQVYAQRAAVVAMTNAQATDVFSADGMTYDQALFHSYADTSGFYMTVKSSGVWTEDGSVWHVDGLLLCMEGQGTYLRATMDVSFAWTGYVVSGVTKEIGMLEQLEAGDASVLNVEQLEPGDATPFLTVGVSLITEDRSSAVEGGGASVVEAEAENVGSAAEAVAPDVVDAADPAEELPQTDGPTIGESNALRSAQSYLDFMPFSYSGLISQLEFEGYTTEEATYAADNCGADWNEQAALKAQSYLDFMSFSREGLIEQLVFEGFTYEQAEYGVTAVGY